MTAAPDITGNVKKCRLDNFNGKLVKNNFSKDAIMQTVYTLIGNTFLRLYPACGLNQGSHKGGSKNSQRQK